MKRKCNYFGWIVISVGIMIVLAVVLPACFWWVMLGVALIFAGLALCRCR